MFSTTRLLPYLKESFYAVLLLASLGLFQAALAAPICGDAEKSAVARTIGAASRSNQAELLRLEAQLYEQYQYCAADGAQLPTSDPFFGSVKQCNARVPTIGSTYFEEMPCCGYDPQRRTFACPVKVKQGFGFGASPLPGSREYVLHCIADSTGTFQPVGVDSVHLSNSTQAPSWQFAVVANANNNLNLLQPMNGSSRTARSILSWNLQPTSCNYKPIWGNAIDYRVRLDQ